MMSPVEMREQSRPWEATIRQLHRTLKRFDEERLLLRKIDESILTEDSADELWLESTFRYSLEALAQIYSLRHAPICYVNRGSDFRELQCITSSIRHPPILTRSATIDTLERLQPGIMTPVMVPRIEETETLYEQFDFPQTILVCPLYIASNQPVCRLIVTDDDMPEGSRLGNSDFTEALAATVTQLSIGYAHFFKKRTHIELQKLWRLFLLSELAPTRCFSILANSIKSFLPDFGPLKLVAPLGVQILILRRSVAGDPQYLTIRATTGSEPDTTRVDIDNSICGLLVRQTSETLPYFCDDPNKPKYQDLYRSYLGEGKGTIQTELAVRIVNGEGMTIGVLNLESDTKDSFSGPHVQALLELIPHIAPMVSVFEERLRHNSIMHQSVASTTAKYLDSLASVFRHGIGSPVANLRTDIDLLMDIIAKDVAPALAPTVPVGGSAHVSKPVDRQQIVAGINSALGRLLAAHDEISGFTSDFSHSISGFGNLGRHRLQSLVGETVALAQESLLAKVTTIIRFKMEGVDDTYVFCSPLLKQYLYCLFHNAILSIQRRMARDPSPGLIAISISSDAPREEMELNKRWIVQIRDNGLGVTRDQLIELRRFHPGTRFRESRGLGLGLVSAQRYMTSIGGRMELDGAPDEHFTAILYFDDYREDLHRPLSSQDVD